MKHNAQIVINALLQQNIVFTIGYNYDEEMPQYNHIFLYYSSDNGLTHDWHIDIYNTPIVEVKNKYGLDEFNLITQLHLLIGFITQL